MALFKIKKGLSGNLPNTYNAGYCYVTTDDAKLYIDTTNAANGRIVLNSHLSDQATRALAANQADKLSTARTILTNLGNNVARGFDGTANIQPGVTGVLPIANGGTGGSTQAAARASLMVPHLNGNNVICKADGNGNFALRLPMQGMLPTQTDTAAGFSNIGSAQEPFREAYIKTVYGNSFQGNANTATKLVNTRTLTVDTAVTAGSVGFDGSSNVTIPITSVKEAYLTWGGRNIVGSLSPLDVATSQWHSANRLQFANPDGITLEKSRDGGATWSIYTNDRAAKVNLVSGIGFNLIVGGASSGFTVNDRARVTLDATACGVYTYLRKILLNINTVGAQGCRVLIEHSMKGSETVFSPNGPYAISGWSAWNSIPFSCSFGGSEDQTGNVAKLRFTIYMTSLGTDGYDNSLRLMDIYFIGETGWRSPSGMANTGHLYGWDHEQRAIFPYKVQATAFEGTATDALKLTNTRTISLAGAVTGSVGFDGSSNVVLNTAANHTHSYAGSTSVGGAANSANKLNVDAGSATSPVYFSNGVPVVCNGTIGLNVESATRLASTRTFTIGNKAVGFNGTANASWTVAEIGAAPTVHTHPQDNNFISRGNEFNFVPSYSENVDIHINYRGGGAGAIRSYKFYNGSPNGYAELTASVLNGNLNGNASSANRWSAARTISLAGAVTGSVGIDGSSNVTINTIANHTHQYAGSSSVGGAATSANKLNSNAGNASIPVYFSNGIPATCSGTIGLNAVSANVLSSTRNFTIGKTTKGFNGSSNLAWSLNEIGALPTAGGNVTGVLQNGRWFYNVASLSSRETLNEVLIKTKIPFISGNSMPLINLKGYCFGGRTPLDLSIVFYVYDNHFSSQRYTSSSGWHPQQIKLFSYIENSTKYVGIALEIPSTYFLKFSVDMYESFNGDAGTNYSDNWTIITNPSTTSVIPSTDLADVQIASLSTNIEGSSSTCTGNAATASRWASTRTISLTGAVTGSIGFDGSANVVLNTAVNHTHSYAGSSSAGGAATSANKLNTNAGNASLPVYFINGVPTVCSSVNLNAASANILANTRNFTIGNTAKGFNGSSNLSWSLAEIGALPVNGGTMNGDIIPSSSNTKNLGSTQFKWSNVYASVFNGDLNGNATTVSGAVFGSSGSGDHDANQINSNGFYYYQSNGPTTSIGASTNDGGIYTQKHSSAWMGQIAQDYRNGRLFIRGKNNTAWTSWLTVLDSANYTNYAATVNHTHSNYLPINNNAVSASKWATARSITLTGDVTGAVSIDGSANVSFVTTVADNSHNHSNYLPISGNAVSANKWATARSITLTGDVTGTVSIDGTANVSFATVVADNSHNHSNYLPINGNAVSATILANARNLTIGNSTKSFNGSANINWSLGEIGASTTNHSHNLLDGDFTVDLNSSQAAAAVGWSAISTSYNGFLLKSIVGAAQNSYPWYAANYGAGICFGGKDVKAVISCGYESGLVKFAGGNGTGPRWNFAITGSPNVVYDLQTMATQKDHTHAYLPLTGGAISGQLSVGGYSLGSYALSASSFVCNGDVVTIGKNGWFNGTYGGGWYMEDADYVRVRGQKIIFSEKGIHSDSAVYSRINSLQYFWCPSTVPVGISVTEPNNPTLDYFYHIRMNYGGDTTTYYNDLAYSINNDSAYFRRVVAGTSSPWKRMWIEGNAVTSAVWNDYAEYRQSDTIEPGYALVENGNDTLSKSAKRLQPFAGISSDTWGFAQGKTEKAETPIAVAGRVLTYPHQNRDFYHSGDCVCTGPNGTVDIMTREEVLLYPDRIIGTVSCVPDYETWGGGSDRDPVKVNGRIWIKVR